MTGPRTYRSGRLRVTVEGERITLDTGERQFTTVAHGTDLRDRIHRAMDSMPRGRKDFQRACRTRCQIIQLRDEAGRPV